MDFISRVFGVGGGRGPTPVGGLTPQERATSLLGLRGSGQFREGLEGLKDLTLQDRVQVLQILMEHKDLQHEVRTTQAVFERATEFFGGESKQDVLFKTAQLYQHELVFSPQYAGFLAGQVQHYLTQANNAVLPSLQKTYEGKAQEALQALSEQHASALAEKHSSVNERLAKAEETFDMLSWMPFTSSFQDEIEKAKRAGLLDHEVYQTKMAKDEELGKLQEACEKTLRDKEVSPSVKSATQDKLTRLLNEREQNASIQVGVAQKVMTGLPEREIVDHLCASWNLTTDPSLREEIGRNLFAILLSSHEGTDILQELKEKYPDHELLQIQQIDDLAKGISSMMNTMQWARQLVALDPKGQSTEPLMKELMNNLGRMAAEIKDPKEAERVIEFAKEMPWIAHRALLISLQEAENPGPQYRTLEQGLISQETREKAMADYAISRAKPPGYFKEGLTVENMPKQLDVQENYLQAALQLHSGESISVSNRIQMDLSQVKADLTRGYQYDIAGKKISLSTLKKEAADPQKGAALVGRLQRFVKEPRLAQLPFAQQAVQDLQKKPLQITRDMLMLATVGDILEHVEQLVQDHPAKNKEETLCAVFSIMHQAASGMLGQHLTPNGYSLGQSAARIGEFHLNEALQLQVRYETDLVSHYVLENTTVEARDPYFAPLRSEKEAAMIGSSTLDLYNKKMASLGKFSFDCTFDIPKNEAHIAIHCVEKNPMYNLWDENQVVFLAQKMEYEHLYQENERAIAKYQMRVGEEIPSTIHEGEDFLALERKVFMAQDLACKDLEQRYERVKENITKTDADQLLEELTALYTSSCLGTARDLAEPERYIPPFLLDIEGKSLEEKKNILQDAVKCFPDYTMYMRTYRGMVRDDGYSTPLVPLDGLQEPMVDYFAREAPELLKRRQNLYGH